MDFAFSEEQQMLGEQARSFVGNKFPHERVAELAESGKPFDEAAWKEIAELGWIGLSVPEDKGGAGFVSFDLPAGDYAAICQIPDPASGKPHLALGMAKGFTVK